MNFSKPCRYFLNCEESLDIYKTNNIYARDNKLLEVELELIANINVKFYLSRRGLSGMRERSSNNEEED